MLDISASLSLKYDIECLEVILLFKKCNWLFLSLNWWDELKMKNMSVPGFAAIQSFCYGSVVMDMGTTREQSIAEREPFWTTF